MDAIKGLVAAGIGCKSFTRKTFYDSTPRFTVKIPIETPKFEELLESLAQQLASYRLQKRYSINSSPASSLYLVSTSKTPVILAKNY